MINDFHKEYNFLSNFFDSPIFEEGIFYPTVEHYFQAMKTLNPVERKGIAHAATPSIAKQLGRQVTLRKDWEQVKDQVMEHALHIKFANPDLKNKLLATEPEYLEEGNWWHDNYWGVCYCSKCQNRGKNHLGHILMALRKELKEMDKQWCIYKHINQNMYPLKWDGQVLIFDTESQAQRFLDSCLNHSMHPLEFFDGAFIKVANKITNEKGSIDASHKFVRYDANKHQDYLEDYR